MTTADLIGTIGVTILLLAFLLSLLKKLNQDSPTYSLLNMIGAGLACYASWMIDYLPFVFLEGTWCLVAAVALLRTLFRRRSAAS
jgi:hypothetical protein